MSDRQDVFRKFGEVSEAAQLLETELGNFLLIHRGTNEGLFESNQGRGVELLSRVNRSTLGQILRELIQSDDSLKRIEDVLNRALAERNRLAHAYFRQHNFRINTEDGCDVMLEDLHQMHSVIMQAYRQLLLLAGIDINSLVSFPLPTSKLPI